MRLYHITSHAEALAIVADGFPGASRADPVCYLLLDSLDALHPLDPAVAALEIEGDLPLQELASGPSGTPPPSGCRFYVATARDLAHARVRLIDPCAGGGQGERLA